MIGEDGLMTEAAGERFAGLTAEDGRRAVVAALRDGGLDLRAPQPYTHDVPHSHRSGERIEPLISLQWFCDMEKLAGPAIARVRKDGRCASTPRSPWTGVYLDWLENIRPWCVSRQLWWGHQIPVWYRGDEVHCRDASRRRARAGSATPTCWTPGSPPALWPFATLGWPDRPPQLRAFYPTDVLSTARDIIFLWVARMVMFGVEFTGELPFTDVPINSVIQAPDGRRMSKSLGTGIDPLDEIDRARRRRRPLRPAGHGLDPGRALLRRAGAAGPGPGQQALERLAADPAGRAGGRRALARPAPSTVEDRWILSRLERVTARTDGADRAASSCRRRRSSCTSSSGRSCATGTWSWPSRASTTRRPTAPPCRPRCCSRSTACCGCCIPLMPHVTEEVWSFMPGRARAAGRGRVAGGGRPRRRTRTPRPRWAARSRRSPSCAATASRPA